MQNLSSLALTQTDLGKFLTFFQEKFRIFLRKFQNFEILKKVLFRASWKASFLKISAHLVVLKKIQKKNQNFLTPEFSQEISKFQNSEYEVHHSSPNNSGSQNFSLLALMVWAEGVAENLSYNGNGNGNGAWQTEKIFSLKTCFLSIKSPKKWKSAIKNFHFFRH